MVFDTFSLEPMDNFKADFIEKKQKTCIKTTEKTEYSILVNWKTQAYQKFLQNKQRKKQIEQLRQQLSKLDMKEKSIKTEKDRYEEAIARPFEVSLFHHSGNNYHKTQTARNDF